MANISNGWITDGLKIGNATVVKYNIGAGYCIPGSTMSSITSLTFHQTGCINVDAPTMSLSLKNANRNPKARKASWHFSVGYNKIYQNAPLHWKCWAQGCSTGNATSISMEMCMYTDKDKQYQTYLNGIALFKFLKANYKSSLVPKAHYDWTKKNCPQWLREGKFGYTWSWFKGQLSTSGAPVVSNPNPAPTPSPAPSGSFMVISPSKKSDWVMRLQRCLNNTYRAGLAVDGYSGPKTYRAVKNRMVGKGKITKGELVKLLQEALGGLTVDGIFGPKTKARIIAFQKAKGLSQDGIFGPNSWKKLLGV